MKKIFTSIFLLITLMAATTGTAFAQDTRFYGTVQDVQFGTDPDTGDTVVLVEVYNDADGTTETFTLSVEYAESLGLVTSDPDSGEPVVADGAVGSTVEVDTSQDLGGEGEDGEEGDGEDNDHPVATKLTEYFGPLLGVDYVTIAEAHDDGFGYGLIAQALWFANNNFEGNTELTFTELLEAKASGDYSNIFLPDGTNPQNWGDVVQASKTNKGQNLGYVMSDKEEKGNGKDKGNTTEDGAEFQSNGNGHGNGNGNGNGGNHGNNGNNGQGKDKSGNKGGNGNNK